MNVTAGEDVAQLPAGSELAAEGHLSFFNLPAFHRLTLGPGEVRRQADVSIEGRLVGSLPGVVTGTTFTCGYSAPFGGIDLARDTESLPRILALVATAVRRLGDEGIETVTVRSRPPIYSLADPYVEFALLGSGFEVESVELNQHLDLSAVPTIGAYVDSLGARGRRDLRLAERLGLRFVEPATERGRRDAYEVLRRNREARGRRPPMPFDYLEALAGALPGRVRTFALVSGDATCAAATMYLIRPRQWLLVYWGDANHAFEQSPMNLLACGLVERAIEEGIALIDLGISSEDGVANPGLVQFKEKVGARTSLRFVFSRRL